jgi:enoyl-CoA hydratase/carnithine racemase
MGVLQSKYDGVVDITLDWPEARNALGPAEARELRLAIEAASANDSIGTIMLSANGKAFCAGGNLTEVVRLAAAGADAVRNTIYGEFQGVFRAIRESTVPVIAAVDGPAVGFGCDLAIAGQMTFIGSLGWLGQGWIHAGLIPATGGIHYVTRRAGPQAVWRLLEAKQVDGPTAESWGLGIACDHARTAALNMATRLAALPRAQLKAMVQLARINDPQAHLAAALDYQVGFITHPDFAALANKLLSR